MTRIIQILSSMLIVSISAFAQSPQFKNFNTVDGLPSSEVYHLLQDHEGYMWFATEHGVSRFDGYRFITYTIKDGLSDNTVIKLFEDSKKRIWILTLSGLPVYYLDGKIHQIIIENSIRKKSVFTIIESKEEEIIIGTEGGLIYVDEYRVGKFKAKSILGNGMSFILNQNSDGSIWGVTDTRIFIIVNQSFYSELLDSLTEYHGNKNSFYFSSQTFTKNMYNIANNRITLKDTNKIKLIKQIFVDYNNHIINFIKQEHNGEILVGTYKNGLFLLQNDSFIIKIVSHILPKKAVSWVLKDRENNLWISTIGHGVFFLHNSTNFMFSKQDGLSDEKIISLIGDGDSLWLGFNNGLVDLVRDSVIKSYDLRTINPKYKRVMSILPDQKGNVYFGLDDGLVKMTKEDKFKEYKQVFLHSIKCLAQYSPTEVLIGTGSTLYYLNGDSISDWGNALGLFPIRVNSILVLPDQSIYLGTGKGLFYISNKKAVNSSGKIFKELQSRINKLVQVNDSLIAIATDGSGLYLIKNQQIITHISTANGLPGDICIGLYSDKPEQLWVGTNRGAAKIRLLKNGKYDISIYNTNSGLVTDDAGEIYTHNGSVYVSSSQGLSVFQDSISHTPDRSFPPVYITGININGKDTIIQKKYTLSYTSNKLRIDFVGISYKSQKNLIYKYRLEGMDEKWNETKLTSVEYPSLDGGKQYKFSVYAMSSSGTWSTTPATVTFTILPPWWQTWWFRGGAGGAIAGIIFLLFRWRVNVVKSKAEAKNELNRKMAEMEMKALRAQMNPHFTFNSLNSIYHYISNNDIESAQKYMTKFASLMRGILDNSRVSFISVAEEVKMLTLYIELEALRFENKFEYRISIDPSIDPNDDEIPSMIIQPYVENAIWHGLMHKQSGKGKLTIRIGKIGNTINCVVEDNGVGRVQSAELKKTNRAQHKSVGMLITKERLDLLNEMNRSNLTLQVTDLYDEAKQPSGTRVEIFIPLGNLP